MTAVEVSREKNLHKRQRNRFRRDVLRAVFLPVGLAFLFLYFEPEKIQWLIFLFSVLFYAISTTIIDVWFSVSKRRKTHLVRSLFRAGIRNSGEALFHITLVFLLVFSLISAVQDRNTETSPKASDVFDKQMETDAAEMETLLRLFSTGFFFSLDEEEQECILNEVLAQECRYLGCEPIPLFLQEIPDDGIGGYFSSGERIIVIDHDVIKHRTIPKIMEILYEEAFHYYQFCCMDQLEFLEKAGTDGNLLFIRQLKEWKENAKNYVNGSDDINAYRNQALEKDAKKYSMDRTSELIEQLQTFAETDTKSQTHEKEDQR